MTAAGLPWTAWLAVVNLASTVIDSVQVNSSSSSSNHLAPAAVVPLIGGLVHVLQHTMISQVRAIMLDMHHPLQADPSPSLPSLDLDQLPPPRKLMILQGKHAPAGTAGLMHIVHGQLQQGEGSRVSQQQGIGHT
jgi:hypothetical protein